MGGEGTRHRRHRGAVVAALLALAVALCGCAATHPSAPAATTAQSGAGTHSAGSLDSSGGTRTFRLYVPAAAAQPASPVPLLVVLHGGGGSGSRFESRSGFDELADTDGFIAVYPDAVHPPGGQVTTWNAGDCCGYAARTGVDDVGFIEDLITTLQRSHRIDPRRVYVAGYSNGGMLAYRLACQDADQIAAVGVQSATLEYAPCRPARPVPLLHIHGTADDHVPLDGGHGSAGVSQADFTPVAKAVGTIATADHCAPDPVSVPQSGATPGQLSEWQGCPPGIAVELITVPGAGHDWMPTSAGAIWDFLAAHPATG